MRLKEKLRGIVPDEHLNQLSDRFHLIGDIAILSLSPAADCYKKEIAYAVMAQNKAIRTVLNKTSRLEGDRRVASFEHLAGGGTVTLHKEYGFVYRLDVAKVFFNSHLGYERMRVASQVKRDENVLVLFSGVGPFAVPLAARSARVVCIEKNREACCWLTENARLNRVEGRIFIITADAFHVDRMMKLDFDRIVIPTPYGMDQILDLVSPVVRKGGMLHFYTFKKQCQIEELMKSYENRGFEIMFHRRCGNVAPGVCRWVFDLQDVK
jgi:tRNA (guanine37-N1)-methyltransferase